MKTITVYEYKDLLPNVQKKVKDRTLHEEIIYEIGENQPWCISSAYYTKNEEKINFHVQNLLRFSLFTHEGKFIQLF